MKPEKRDDKRKRNILLFIILVILIAAIIGINYSKLTGRAIFAASYSFSQDYSFAEPIITIDGDYAYIDIDGLQTKETEGKPIIPFKTAKILLPQNAEVSSIDVKFSNKKLIGNYNLQYGAKEYEVDSDTPLESAIKDESIYGSNNPYPNKKNSDVNIQDFKGYKIALINLYPIEFIPKKQEVYFYENAQIKINYKKINKKSEFFRNKKEDKEEILSFVDNPEYINSYSFDSSLSVSGSVVSEGSGSGGSEQYDYAIITEQKFASAFQVLADYKTKRGLKTKVILVEDIIANPNYDWNGQFGDKVDKTWFKDKAAKIRNFIKDSYINYGVDYILLGGDGDIEYIQGGNRTIPSRGIYNYVDYADRVPSDAYYSNLNGSFDADLDGIFGETTDNVDFLAEVYVGRAPVDTVEEVNNFVSKTITYENSNLSDAYLRKLLMAGESKLFSYEGDSKCKKDAATVSIPNNKFTKEELWDDNYTTYIPVFISKINSNANSFINHVGHSTCRTGLNLDINNIPQLNNTKPFFAYGMGCHAGAFDNAICDKINYSDPIGERYVKTRYSAFAVIMNSRAVWDSGSKCVLGSSMKHDKAFIDRIFADKITILGEAFALSKQSLITSNYNTNYDSMRWNYFASNLLGDPSLNLKLYMECEDFDSGLDYYNKAKVNLISGASYEDSCSGNNVIENYCDRSLRKTITYTCPSGYTCNTGACVENVYTCTDSDNGLNYNIKGTVTTESATYSDNCKNSSILNESYCENNIGKTILHQCVCAQGTCLLTPPPSFCGDGMLSAGEICDYTYSAQVCPSNYNYVYGEVVGIPSMDACAKDCKSSLSIIQCNPPIA